MNKNNFHYVDVLLDMLYGIQLEPEDVEEIGLIAWNLIGNRDVRLYNYTTCMLPKDKSISLPCNAISVEAVTTSYEDWKKVTNYSENGDYRSAFIENSIEIAKRYKSPYYISGKLIPYEQVKDKLYFSENYGSVNILYKGILADEEGLPELTDKEATAIATYIAYVTKFKEGLVTNNTVTINLAQSLNSTWLKQCDQARVTYLNQNDMNDILNIKSNWDRHNYGYSYKPIR